ncbi:MAG: hypothetical protein ACRENA_02120 [Vulcanimicrobiaceae bacterium]
MSSEGPRRRRTSGDDEERGGLPMVPLFAAVIIAGLGIGALLSAFAARHSPPPVAKSSPLVVVHTPTPAAAKVAEHATGEPTVTVRATPEPASPSPEASTASPAPSPSQTTAAPTQQPSATPSPKKSVAPRRVVSANTAPAQRIATPGSAPVEEAATSLVRGYLEAVAHGDDAAARSALGGSSAPEDVPYLDPSLRITSLTAAKKNGVTEVQVEFRTVKGQYFGTFTVDETQTRILQHELIPVGGTSAR